MKKLFLSIIFCIINLTLFADSSFLPALYHGYSIKDNKILFDTRQNGISAEKYIEYLVSDENTLGQKVALIVELASYFEWITVDDNPDNDSEDYFELYSYYFEDHLKGMYADTDSMPNEMRFLRTLMDDYGTSLPNIEAYNRFAEMMPQSLTVQSVKVYACDYDAVYNRTGHERMTTAEDIQTAMRHIQTYETEYLNPYMENFEHYTADISTNILDDIDWREYMYDDLPDTVAVKYCKLIPDIEAPQTVEDAETVSVEAEDVETQSNPLFHISISQNGKDIKVGKNVVTLQKKRFEIVVFFSEPMGILISASLNDKTHMPASKQKPLDELPAFQSTGMAEGLFNEKREIMLSDDAPSYWYYDNPDDHRFNSIDSVEQGIIAVREIEYMYDVNTKTTIPVADIKKPLYLVFVSYRYGENWEREEIYRQCIKIQWN